MRAASFTAPGDGTTPSIVHPSNSGERAGGTLTIEYSYDIRQIDIAHNNRSATVEIATTLKMGEEFMQIFSESTDRIERSMRKVQLVAQDAKVRMRWTPGAIAHPEQYFQAQ
jgi:hypothetical protein